MAKSRSPQFWDENLQRIFDASLDPVIAIDQRGMIVGWNSAATDLFGWTTEEALQLTLTQSIIPERQRNDHETGMRRYLETGEANVLDRRVELVARNKHGEEFPVELSASEVQHGGQPYFLGFVRDITRRKRMIDDMAESRERMQLILDSTEEAIYGVDLEGNCMFCNASCVRQLGYESTSELLGKNMHDLIHHTHPNGDEYDIADCPIYQSYTVEQGVHVEDEVFWAKDGSKFPVDYRSHPILRNGKPVGIVVTFVDISERQEDAEYRARMAALVDSSYDAIIGKDLDGIITSWNYGAQRVYGYTEEESLGKSITMLLPHDALAEEPEVQEAVQTGQRLEQFETLRQRKDGEIISISLTVSPITDDAGRIVGSSTIERDISERKRQEEELRRAKDVAETAQHRAQRALAVRGEFLANVSHELRTPMNSILGMLQLSLGEELSPIVREYLATAQESANSLLALLNDILDFSRMEAGKFSVESQPFHLREMLDEAMKTASAGAFKKGLELACEVDTLVPDELVGDEGRLRQIIINLVSNAVKFTEQGEVVVLVQAVRRWPNEVRLKFSVRDTGCGITHEDQKRIFEAFMQADASTTRGHGGVGLGLAICTELLRQMGSRIRVASEIGKGSTFSFVVSLPRAANAPPAKPSVPIDQLRGLPVLVVDDNETNRRILDQSLRSWEMEPTLASSGSQALTLLRQAAEGGHMFSLAIIDALMPEMDGMSLAGEIQEDPRIARPPMILMISSTDRQTFAGSENDAVSTFLSKPVSQSDLLDAIVRCLNVAPPENLEEVITGETPIRPLRVLLAEDTPANQKVVTSILAKRGHDIAVANNGREAVDHVINRDFDVVLMDVQMPIMDGYQATASIRALANERAAQIPIIAMTAHAMRGDREKCLQAGMDAYLTKPVDVEELLRMVESVAEAGALTSEKERLGRERETAAHIGTNDALGVMDLEVALQRLRNDEDLLLELADVFLDDSPGLVSEIRIAAQQNDAATLRRVAHSLKGLAANFNAQATIEAAQALETMGESGQLEGALDVLDQLAERVAELTAALRDFRNSRDS